MKRVVSGGLSWWSFALAVGLATGAGACHPTRPAESASTKQLDALGAAFASASETEQRGDGKTAVARHLALVDQGLGAGDAGVGAVAAGLDALVWRQTAALSRVSGNHALVYRVPGALDDVRARLTEFSSSKRGSAFARSLVAMALLDLARFSGDAPAATRWRTEAGVITHATVVGPLSAATLTSLGAASPLEEGAVRDRYPGVGPFAAAMAPLVVEADDGALDVGASSTQPGLHVAVVDVEVPRAQRVWVAIQSTAAVQVAAGGRAVVSRPYALGGSAAMRVGWVEASAGTLRVAVRLGNNEDGARVQLVVVGADGAPLTARAPAVGAAANASATAAGAFDVARPGASVELNAAALLALGDGRTARRLLEDSATSPGAALLYARTLGRTDDTPENRRIERARAAYDQVLTAWPDAWEAHAGAALLAAARKGFAEGRVESLRDLGALRAKTTIAPPLRAFEAATAAEAGLRDVALEGLAALREPLSGTSLLASLEEKVQPRVGAEAEARVCSPRYDRSSLACLQMHQRRGDLAGARTELARLRELRGSARALPGTDLALALGAGDAAQLTRVVDAMTPSERTLGSLGLLPVNEVKARLERDRTTARDAPAAIGQLRRLLGDDPAPALEAEGSRVIAQHRGAGGADTSATLVLLHTERYELAADGLLHGVVHDVRRVAGTTDVEQGVGGTAVSVTGRDMRKLLRRLIHKRDGRRLEPDAAAMATQGNSDLSQLEPGDYIEQIIETWALPDRTGNLVVDTPDLLPERTGVQRAEIELRHPRSVRLSRWSHPLLGRPDERDEGEQHIVRYTLQRQPPRRIEDSAPRMDRDVALSFGTYQWADVGRHLGELIAALGDDDPYVARWAHQASGEGADATTVVRRIVEAAGKTVRVPQANLLSDTSAALASGPQALSARPILELGQGSRSWVIYRALQLLRVPVEIVVAEREPFSADPAFPPRPARFDHSLVVAHLPDGDVWIDADVPGAPLPAGQVSPELRGRVALRTTGDLVPVQGASAESARDEVEVSLKVDDRGDARGTVALQLRGRAAQAIADALERVAGADRLELLRAVVLAWVPWATVNEATLTTADASGTLALRADVTVPALAQGEGQGWTLPGLEPLHSVLPRPVASTLGATYAARLGRQSALAIDASVAYRVRRHLELPPSWKAPQLPPPASIKHDLFEASRSGKVSGSTLDEEFSLSVTSGTVAPDAYERFAAQAKRADDAFLAGVRVSR